MFDLNDVAAIHQADPQNMLGHILNLPQQLEDGWATAAAIDLPPSFRAIDRVVIAGMGGSAIGGSLLAALMAPVSTIPIAVVRDYDLPAFAIGSNTLVIASSYSGDTEETLSVFEQARARECQLLVTTTGGRLLELVHEFGVPFIQINDQSQPHVTLGWSLAPLLNIASRLQWLHDLKDDLIEAVSVMRAWSRDLAAESPIAQNLAKREAGQLMGRIVFVFGAGYFAEVARHWKGQLNKNAKAWAAFEVLPEADHHLLAGTDWPHEFSRQVMALFLTGRADHPRNVKRAELTRQMFMLAGCNTDMLIARGQSPLAQMMALIHLGNFMSFYLALLNGAEPAQIDALANFKAAMTND